MDGVLRIVGAGIALVGAVVIVLAWRHRARSRRWPRVEAIVESIERRRRTDRSTGLPEGANTREVSVASYRFRNPHTGQEQRGEVVVPHGAVSGSGATLVLAHHPAHPDRVILPGGSTGGAIAGTVVGLIFVGVGLFFALTPVSGQSPPGW